ncbi:MAG TPA: ATP-binding protein [Streptosporangiaceae bacterium]|nr:ATP-binding protein [Streptosporangiaceae bacterium]
MNTWHAGAGCARKGSGEKSDVDRQVNVVAAINAAVRDAVTALATERGGRCERGERIAGKGGAGRTLVNPAGPDLFSPDELPDGLVVADGDGVVTVFNRAAERLTGIDARQAVGAKLPVALPLADSEGRCWWGVCRPYDGLSTRTRGQECSLYLTDGTELLVTIGYVRGPRNGGGTDRRAVQRLTITLRSGSARARLERTRADLVSTVAHELRSPLTSVKGFTATLLEKWPRFTDDQKRVMLETVNADADRVTRLITELLDVSRIEAGRIVLHRELVDIAARASKLVAGRVAAGENASRFKIQVAEALPETWLDGDKIDQILANLIENAVRHGAGTVTTVIEAAQVCGGPGIAVSVRDQGPGIAPEFAPRVFRQFWRAKRRGGAGLGLFIVKGLVEAHGGSIAVAKAPGGGAEFRFTMPAGTPDHG